MICGIIERYLHNNLSPHTISLKIISATKIIDSFLIDEANTALSGLATFSYDNEKILFTRNVDWDPLCIHILEHMDVVYLANCRCNFVNKFARCLAGYRDVEPVISLGNFLEIIQHIMRNKSIKKIKVYKDGSTYKFNGRRFDLTRSYHELLDWEREMTAIGWIFISSIGISRSEKIMWLADITVSTTD